MSNPFLSVSWIVILLTLLTLGGMGYAELPELLPRETFFSMGGAANVQISPDGKFISHLAPSKEGILNVWVNATGKTEEKMVTHETKNNFMEYYWAYDNRHILYLRDTDGDENFHVFATDIETGTTTDLTPYKGVKAQNILLNAGHANEVLVGLNIRNKSCFDMYRIDIQTGKMKQETENPGDVRWWLADYQFVVRAAVAIDQTDSSTTLRIRDRGEAPWRDLIRWSFGETGLLEGYGKNLAMAFMPDGKALFVQAAFEGDQTQLAKVDAATGKVIAIMAKSPHASIWNIMGVTLYEEAQVLFHPKTGELQAAAFDYLKPEWTVYDPALTEDFNTLKKIGKGVFRITGRDTGGERWIVTFISDDRVPETYLYDQKTKQATRLFEPATQAKKYLFSPMEPVEITARDGMTIPCYLTLPVGIPAQQLPLILFVHGGPWARDEWGFSEFDQWLANRGYAVLHVNFRGSSGLGKKFMNAGTGQWGVGSMQHDLTDAVHWFVKKGIADPKRVAIFGGSYGGYATLAGLTFTPEVYACGIAMSGISNVKTSLDTMPPWWNLIKTRWIKRIGSPIMTDAAFNRRISPYYHADQIKAKLLIFHGVNDPRVSIEESNQIVSTMRKNKKDVVYVVYKDEGHGIDKPQNLMDALGRVEDFLAQHLGGRKQPWQAVPGSSAELR